MIIKMFKLKHQNMKMYIKLKQGCVEYSATIDISHLH